MYLLKLKEQFVIWLDYKVNCSFLFQQAKKLNFEVILASKYFMLTTNKNSAHVVIIINILVVPTI